MCATDSIADIEFARSFFVSLRSNPWLSQAWFVFVCERNTGHESGHIANVMLNFDPRSIAVKQTDTRDYGWWTSNDLKIGYAAAARTQLAHRSVMFLDDMVIDNPFLSSELSSDDIRVQVKQQFIEELSRVRKIAVRHDNPMTLNRMTVSGKVGNNGKVMHGLNDDMFMTFAMAIWFTNMLIEHRLPYIDYHALDLY